jgi:tRNA nucleotidyltransferase (CCA-adding enzyme)
MPQSFKHGGIYPQLLKEISSNLKKELDYLRDFFAPYSSRVYIVGGAVRDLVRKSFEKDVIEITDLDIEVFGIDERLFQSLMQKLKAKGVGKSFFVYKYKESIDISLPRVESKIGIGHKAFEVKLAKDEKEASIRRDFRMNALMLNIFNSKLLDFYGGIEDIRRKKISIIDEKKFIEDSLRVLRGVQFSARFGYKIDGKSCDVMRDIELNDLSKERIFWEFEKLFLAKFLHYGLYYLLALDIDKKIFNINLNRAFFFKTAKELKNAQRGFEKELRKFYFLYIFAKNQHRNFEYFLDILQVPKEYYRHFKHQKFLPHIITQRFLAALSLQYPLKEYLGNYKENVKIMAKELDLWDKRFQAFTPKEIIKEGFSGKEISIELRKRNLEAIKRLFKGRI